MFASCWRNALILGIAIIVIADPCCEHPASSAESGKKSSSKKSSKKRNYDDLPPIQLPDDPNTVVLSYDPGVGAGQPARQGEPPYLKILADGTVKVTNPETGAQASSQLNEKDWRELLEFVIYDQEFLTLTAAMLDEEINKLAATSGSFTDVRGIGTSVIAVKLADKQNSVSYRAAMIYHKKLPKAKEIARFAETEKRLSDLALKVGKGKKR